MLTQSSFCSEKGRLGVKARAGVTVRMGCGTNISAPILQVVNDMRIRKILFKLKIVTDTVIDVEDIIVNRTSPLSSRSLKF